MTNGLTLTGTVVEIESKPWQFNGREGVSHKVFVRTGSDRDGAVGVKVSFEQIEGFKGSEGDTITLPVRVRAQASDFGEPRAVFTVEQEYRHVKASKHSGASPRPLAAAQ